MQNFAKIEATARALCRADSRAESALMEITKDFYIPYWVTYISRAIQLVREQEALSGKK